jgi:hypothetical protein
VLFCFVVMVIQIKVMLSFIIMGILKDVLLFCCRGNKLKTVLFYFVSPATSHLGCEIGIAFPGATV